MLPTFVIGLREGMEAALIVGIVAAFLGQQGRSDALRQVWIGVTIAVAICVAIGVALQIISEDLPQQQQEGLETVVGAIAVVMVTYMVLWMRRHSRDLKGDLEAAAGSALAHGSAKALVAMAFLAVLREGFETVVFLLATFHASGNATLSWVGALLGILLAVVLGYMIYKGGVRINLSRFFRITGIVLVVIAAGLVMTAVHTANEAGWLNFGQNQAFDLSWLVRPGTPLESFVTGVLGIQPYPVWIEVIAYLAYLVPMLVVMSWPRRRRPVDARGDGRADGSPALTTSDHLTPQPSPTNEGAPSRGSNLISPPPRPAGITCERDVPACWVGPSRPPSRAPERRARWSRAGRRGADGVGSAGGRRCQADDGQHLPDPERLHPQTGQGHDRSDSVQRGKQERRGRLGGRAADQGPVPHPRRAGEPDTRALRRVRARRATRQLRHQLPRSLPAARRLHRDREGQGGLRPDEVTAHDRGLGLLHLREPTGGRSRVVHAGPLRRHQHGQPDPGAAGLPAGTRLLRAH